MKNEEGYKVEKFGVSLAVDGADNDFWQEADKMLARSMRHTGDTENLLTANTLNSAIEDIVRDGGAIAIAPSHVIFDK